MWEAIKTESARVDDAEAFRQWAADVGNHGGDDPQRTLELVEEIIDGKYAETTGQFLWIEGGLQQPINSWR